MLRWFFVCSIPFHLNCIPFLGVWVVWLSPVYRRVIWFFAVCCRVVHLLSVHCKIKSICLLQLQTDKPIISLPVFLGLSSAILVRVITITTANRSTAAADPIPAAMAAIKKVQQGQMELQTRRWGVKSKANLCSEADLDWRVDDLQQFLQIITNFLRYKHDRVPCNNAVKMGA